MGDEVRRGGGVGRRRIQIKCGGGLFVSVIVGRRQLDDDIVACTRFRRHQVWCDNGTGGGSWSDGSLRGSSSLRLYA